MRAWLVACAALALATAPLALATAPILLATAPVLLATAPLALATAHTVLAAAPVVLVTAPLALATAAHAGGGTATLPPDPARLHHIKEQILAKLGLSVRPRALGAPPRDVVRQILARASEPLAPTHAHHEPAREVIAIAHRGRSEQIHDEILLDIKP